MKKEEKWIKINNALREIKISNRIHVNCIRLNPTCSDLHNNKIISLCLEFLKNQIPFMTEAEFIYGGRADLITLYDKTIYEVMVSETDKSIENKIKKYPDSFKIVKVRV